MDAPIDLKSLVDLRAPSVNDILKVRKSLLHFVIQLIPRQLIYTSHDVNKRMENTFFSFQNWIGSPPPPSLSIYSPSFVYPSPTPDISTWNDDAPALFNFLTELIISSTVWSRWDGSRALHTKGREDLPARKGAWGLGSSWIQWVKGYGMLGYWKLWEQSVSEQPQSWNG